jgi:hypothetical protein
MGAGNRQWSGGSTHNWSGRNWNGHNWNGNRHHHDHFHHGHFHHGFSNRIVFIGDFGFPLWWGWGWGWPYPYGYYGYYPYDYYGDGYGYGYDQSGYDQSGYGGSAGEYGVASQSRVAELQRRLARAGYYRGSIDGILGPETRRAIRAYERDHGNVG